MNIENYIFTVIIPFDETYVAMNWTAVLLFSFIMLALMSSYYNQIIGSSFIPIVTGTDESLIENGTSFEFVDNEDMIYSLIIQESHRKVRASKCRRIFTSHILDQSVKYDELKLMKSSTLDENIVDENLKLAAKEIRNVYEKVSSVWTKKSAADFVNVKLNFASRYKSLLATFFYLKNYESLADSIPSGLDEDNNLPVPDSKLKQVKGKYSWIPCTLREYDYSSARICAASMKLKNSSPLGITFFGDSKARQLMGDLFKILDHESWKFYISPRYDPKNMVQMNAKLFRTVIDYHFHNRNLTWIDRLARSEFNFSSQELIREEEKFHVSRLHVSEKYDEASDEVFTGLIRLKYHIALYIHHQEMERSIPTLLERLKEYELQHPLELPSLFVISSIMWEIHPSKQETLNGMDRAIEQLRSGKTELYRLLRLFKSRGVTIVWMLMDPVRNKLLHHTGDPVIDIVHPWDDYMSEIFNTISITLLRPLIDEGVILPWDSSIPVSQRVNRDCEILTSFSNKTETISQTPNWRCWDFLHPHYQTNQVNAQMLLNFVCNGHLNSNNNVEYNNDFCCSDDDVE